MPQMNPDQLCMLITPSWQPLFSIWIFCLLLITTLLSGTLFLHFRKKNNTPRKANSIELKTSAEKARLITDITFQTYPPLNTDNSLHQVSTLLNNLFDELGHLEACDFVKLCIQELTKTSKKLNQHIQNEDWNTAKKITHRLLGTSNLYATMKFQELLHSIDSDMMSSEKQIQVFLEVQSELTLILDYMNNTLKSRLRSQFFN